MKVVLTGGGTGGHIYPAISVGQALRESEPGVDLLFVGSSHGPEGKLAAEAGLPFKAVPSSPLTKSVSLRSAAALYKLVAGVFRARGILSAFGPDVVVGTGGYTTAAVLIAARSLGLKVVIHEQNAVPGRTNLWLARISRKVCVSVDSSAAFFPSEKVVVTGMPVRGEFASLPAKADARKSLGLDPDAFTLVVVGGSQGAKRVNDVVASAWPLFDDGKMQIFHQVGPRNIEEMRAKSIPNSERYKIEAYVEMPLALASADLVISRSGASTIAEITAAAKPSILFPYPYAYANHQKHNAAYLVQHGAAVLCEDETVNSQMLANVIMDLRDSPDKLKEMSAASATLARIDAAQRVADVVRELV